MGGQPARTSTEYEGFPFIPADVNPNQLVCHLRVPSWRERK